MSNNLSNKKIDTSLLELVHADLNQGAGWQEAVHRCNFVIHIASPYPTVDPIDENELIIPARDGTLRVLHAAQAADVQRVIFLSTIGAIYDGHQGENRKFDETDGSDLSKIRSTYHKSKTLTEKAAWEFIRSIENRSNMEMVSINPTNVFGPVLDNHYHSSIEWFRTLMHSEIPGIPHYQLDFVDVRDLVDILTKAMTELTRFFCQGDGLFFTEAFPDLEFSCGDSWENTIAFGKDHCEYILEVKEPV